MSAAAATEGTKKAGERKKQTAARTKKATEATKKAAEAAAGTKKAADAMKNFGRRRRGHLTLAYKSATAILPTSSSTKILEVILWRTCSTERGRRLRHSRR
jgi:hypothetical protein